MFQRGLFAICGLTFLLLSCSNDGIDKSYVDLDLIKYGVPLVVKAPEGIDVTETDMIVSKELTIKKNGEYDVMVNISETTGKQMSELKAEQLTYSQSNPYFKEIVLDEEDGFIYHNQIDSIHSNYGFKYLLIKADKEIVVQSGLSGNYDLETAKKMYKAVRVN